MGGIILSLTVFLPFAGAFVCWLTGRKSEKARDIITCCITAAVLCLAGAALYAAAKGTVYAFDIDGVCGIGLHLRADGFRALYSLIAVFMWFATSLFSPEYFAHVHSRSRYCFFYLLTMGATTGVFLSADLYTLFIFFEIMSLTSYCLVAHEETPGAMRAAQTYLAVAVGGGMVTLMGLFMLYSAAGTLVPEKLLEASSGAADRTQLYIAGALTSVGFLAKAGSFPLHIWLPKAHPVAPAPASALLSGILTKTGVFGLISVSCSIFYHNAVWGNTLLILGLISMFLGAVLALFSMNLKRTLACSSMSQIGFIVFGIAVQALLGQEDDGLAVYGTVMHMMNHSLLKLALFMAAGAIYMKAHTLDLNELRGYGRNKPILHFVFLMGALGLAGVPLLNGYISKSLLHEGLLHFMEHHAAASALFAYKAAEWVFMITGGLTAAYMTKLYVILFWEKNPDRQAEYDSAGKNWANPISKGILLLCGALLPMLGLLPGVFLQGAAGLSAPFFNSAGIGENIAYFSGENLLGALKSLLIAAAVYLIIVRHVLRNKDGLYLDRWPKKLDLEELIYRPLVCRIVPGALGLVSRAMDKLAETAFAVIKPIGTLTARTMDNLAEGIYAIVKPIGAFTARLMDHAVDGAALLIKDTVLQKHEPKHRAPAGKLLPYWAGTVMNGIVYALNHTILIRHPIERDFTILFSAERDVMNSNLRKIVGSISFGLILTSIGLLAAFIYMLYFR